MRIRATVVTGAVLALVLLPGRVALAQTPQPAHEARSAAKPRARYLEWAVEYSGDVIAVTGAGVRDSTFYLDNLSVTGALDLERLIGWKGARLAGQFLNNLGGRPNDVAGTLEGVDNIEVADPAAKVFELYLDQNFAAGRLLARIGFFDLNAEFYTTDAAGLLIGPAFGIGSELASTGPNGPSIFPSTSVGALLRGTLAGDFYVQAAGLNAESGVPGDPDGINLSFRDGALLIAETGWTGLGKLAIGGWAYTTRQADIRDLDPVGEPERRRAFGAYFIAERPFFSGDEAIRATSAFVRLGVSEGETTPFAAGAQTGLHVARVFEGRAESELSLGLRAAKLNSGARANLRDLGAPPAAAEYGIELTFSDRVYGPLRLQPLFQWNANSGGIRETRSVFVLGFRFGIAFGQ